MMKKMVMIVTVCACFCLVSFSITEARDLYNNGIDTYRGSSYGSSSEQKREYDRGKRDGYRQGMLHQEQQQNRQEYWRINPRNEQTLGDPQGRKPKGSRSLLY